MAALGFAEPDKIQPLCECSLLILASHVFPRSDEELPAGRE
jgi:hypothetical protein